MSVLVRVARPEEYAEIGALSVEAYRDNGQLDERYAGFLLDVRARAEHGMVLVAVDEQTGAVLGGVTLVLPGSRFAELCGEGEAEFRALAVAPDAQRRGVGEALVRACLDRAGELGAHAVVICTRDIAVSAQQLYERLGFMRTPERDWFPMPGIVLLTLRCELPLRSLAG
jgi:ribosomal protein S18 acetylase RimI-like enzyme